MKIKKVSQSAGIIAEIEQNLDSNSEVNAPSVKAVKEALKQVYSTEEQVIGTWMGKPLYRKEFHGTTSTEEGTFLVYEGNVKHIVFSKGYIVYFDGTGEISNVIDVEIGKSALALDECSRVLNIDGNLRLDCGSLLRNKKFEIIIEYTKTTD